MQIYINKSTTQNPVWKLAALKKGTSFEYVSENRLFSGSDGYSLTITFPLKDCPQNLDIFGHVNRADVSAGKVIFDCEIRDRNFYKFGCITITEINEAEVKTQFLDGRSEQNFDSTLDKIYINELYLGTPPTTAKNSISPSGAWAMGSSAIQTCLPWVNNASGNMQNCATFTPNSNGQSGGTYAWHEDTKGLSWQIYLIEATRRICAAIGYSCDLSEWRAKNEYKYLLICNTLPFSWYSPEYARALPHWTVEEYFEKLELFLGCEFDFDHRSKSISFAFTRDVLAAKYPVRLDNVVEEHSTEVKVEEPSCEYSESKNLVYKDCDHEMWKYYSCDWFIKAWKASCIQYGSMTELLAANSWLASWSGYNVRNSNMNLLLYAADVDAYFIVRTVSRTDTGHRTSGGRIIVWEYKCILQPVNLLGGRIVDDSDDAAQDEIEFVPAWIDYTDDTYGFCLFLSFSGYDEETTSTSHCNGTEPYSDEWYAEKNNYFAQSVTAQSIAAGQNEKKSEYYDRIYIGWWNGVSDGWNSFPYPAVENVVVAPDWSAYRNADFSLRLNDNLAARAQRFYQIEPSMKTTFKFIADKMPDVRSLFIIRGKRYICEKLTATFTEQGMSQLVKGVFYPVKESTD